jgi:hypothetical protein
MATDAILAIASKTAPASFLTRDGAEIFFYAPLIAILIASAFLVPHKGIAWFSKIEHFLARLGRHKTKTILAIGLLSLLVVVGLTAIASIPIPKVDDEFSYLLAADTFAHGRLTNPTHPLWKHFETFHTIQQPTYASRYPPGQGLVLALGQILGQPVIGVWLSTAVACAAICWMLMGWLPARWAIVGAFLAILHPEILFWSQRYWGGSLTLAGGALTLGGFRRLLPDRSDQKFRPQLHDAVLMSVGMSLLIICRPYEGGVLILILLTTLAIFSWKGRFFRTVVTRAGLPIAAGLIITVAWMGYYNWRVTQDPFRMPQQVYIATYNAAPVFLWQQPPSPPVYRHKQMQDFHMGWELRPYLKQRKNFGGFASGVLERFLRLLRSTFRLWPLLPAFAAVPWALKNQWTRLALLIWLVFTAALFQVTWTFFHYAAPAFGLFFIVAVQCLRHLRLWRWHGKPAGLFLARGCVILSVLSLPLTFWSVAQQNRYVRRNNIIARLKHEGGKHLVVVHYDPADNNSVEWVYNSADIDHSQIVWARELDAARDRELLNYFKDRHPWLLQVSRRSTHLMPYPASSNL